MFWKKYHKPFDKKRAENHGKVKMKMTRINIKGKRTEAGAGLDKVIAIVEKLVDLVQPFLHIPHHQHTWRET